MTASEASIQQPLANVESPCSPQTAASTGDKKVIATKVLGTVKWFNVKNGYGFIIRNDTKDCVFVHQKAIKKKNPRKYLRSVGDGETVEFDVVEVEKGVEAINVTGPDGAPVQGSKYTPDISSGYRNRNRAHPRDQAYMDNNFQGNAEGESAAKGHDHECEDAPAEAETQQQRPPMPASHRQHGRRAQHANSQQQGEVTEAGEGEENQGAPDQGNKPARQAPPRGQLRYKPKGPKPMWDGGEEGKEGQSGEAGQNYQEPRKQRKRGNGSKKEFKTGGGEIEHACPIEAQ